jgi:hypothetical protein
MGKSRDKVAQSSDSLPSLGTKETSFKPPPVASVSTQNGPKPVIRISSNNGSTVSSVDPRPHRPRPPSVCDSEIPVTPSGESLMLLTPWRLTSYSRLLSWRQ